ncbi:hypothetical protein HY407_01645 [Candidatus Gottesmanbacteria bacterium]|nr:hypothetical protein [Candidatus Gottesmanbacteria bacterium]
MTQKFDQEPGEPKMAHLQFLRWLAERGELEHRVAGPPAGELAEKAAALKEAETIMASYD